MGTIWNISGSYMNIIKHLSLAWQCLRTDSDEEPWSGYDKYYRILLLSKAAPFYTFIYFLVFAPDMSPIDAIDQHGVAQTQPLTTKQCAIERGTATRCDMDD